VVDVALHSFSFPLGVSSSCKCRLSFDNLILFDHSFHHSSLVVVRIALDGIGLGELCAEALGIITIHYVTHNKVSICCPGRCLLFRRLSLKGSSTLALATLPRCQGGRYESKEMGYFLMHHFRDDLG